MKKCLIIENSYKDEAKEIGCKISEYLESFGIASSHFILAQEPYVPRLESVPFAGNDFVITLGGDGTVLFAARGCAPLGIPVFPVNLGQFGFIAGIQKDSWEKDLELFINGKIEPANRTMLKVDVFRGDEKFSSSTGLNDIILTTQIPAEMVSFSVAYKESLLGNLRADGILVSTATGSTAYSVSAGGPIVEPELDAFVLTCVNPFSLSARPLVFNSEGTLIISILPDRNDKIRAVVDGQISMDLICGDKVIITKSPHKAILVGCSVDNFYEALRSKLDWAGGPHA